MTIYSNKDIKSIEREIGDYKINVINLGEKGRGRREISLPCDSLRINKGKNEGLAIGETRSGRPRIIQGDGKYAFISTEGGYTRRGCGMLHIFNEDKNNIRVIAKGNGADGIAGRIGDWDAYVIEILEDCIFKIRYSGGGESKLIISDENGFKYYTKEEYLDLHDLKDVDARVKFRTGGEYEPNLLIADGQFTDVRNIFKNE